MINTSITQSFDWLDFLSGLGIFLLGMLVLEKSLAHGAQSGVRKWLFNHTKTPLAAIATGTSVTAFLQSSSLVTLILMAMVGANILPLTNAIGAVLGANLGTTFTGWLVTVLGFKLELGKMALPILGLGGLMAVFFESRTRLYTLGGLLCGIGLLLFGLSLMKTSVEMLPEVLDLPKLIDRPAFVLLLFGAILTAIIQSSSATMMIVLTLLHAELIQLQEAAALIIGADLGTTSTSALAALKAQSTRRSLAAAHILFNIVTDLMAFIIFLPLLPWLQSVWIVTDPLLQLVLFHSLFNIFGILLFYPFLNSFARLINTWFEHPNTQVTHFIHAVPSSETELAIIALDKEVKSLQADVLRFCWRAVDGKQHTVRYQNLKIHEGEIIQYGTCLSHPASPLLLSAARDCIYAAKSLGDVVEDWALEHTPRDSKDVIDLLYSWRSNFRRHLAMIRQLCYQSKQSLPLELDAIDRALKKTYRSQMDALHLFATHQDVGEEELSTLLNLNRELLNSLQSLRSSVSGLNLSKQYIPSSTGASSFGKESKLMP